MATWQILLWLLEGKGGASWGVLCQKELSGLIQTFLPSKTPKLGAAVRFPRSVLGDWPMGVLTRCLLV